MILHFGIQRDIYVILKWYNFIEPSEWIWHVEDVENDKGVYVDLKLNPEAFTGY